MIWLVDNVTNYKRIYDKINVTYRYGWFALPNLFDTGHTWNRNNILMSQKQKSINRFLQRA